MSDIMSIIQETIQSQIFSIQGKQVMLDRDLALLYGVETKRLNEQVKRNLNRLPGEFMFELTKDEQDSLRSQFATLKKRGTHSKYLIMANKIKIKLSKVFILQTLCYICITD